MRKILPIVMVLIITTFAFAGDAAAFVDMGFSKDGSIYVFGQHGKIDKSFQSYAEIFTVDVKKNDFIKSGLFTKKDTTNKASVTVFEELKEKHKSYLDKLSLSTVKADSLLYLRQEDAISSEDKIVFQDFVNSTTENPLFYHVKLVPLYEGKGTNTRSSFYIVIEKKSQDGTLITRNVVGNPDIKRKGVTNYTINRIFTSPQGNGLVFVVEKTVEDTTGTSIRYMVETTAL